jgi:hypothetical protein
MLPQIHRSGTSSGISRCYLAVAIVLTIAIFIGICVLFPRMRALRHDTAANFWYATTGVDIGITKKHLPFPSYCIFDGGRFIYGDQYPFESYFDLDYESVSEPEAEADFPRVQAELEKRVARNDPDDCIATGYQRWHAIVDWNGGISGLMDEINTAYFEHAARQTPPILPNQRAEFRHGLVHVAQADRIYWVCFLFETFYLSAIVWFTLWPYIHRAGVRRKLLRIAILPLLLILPNWFGYYNSAGPAFPRGGILYPYMCWMSFPFPENFDWEFKFLGAIPPFLSVISQGRVVTFADYYNFRGMIPYQNGPVKIAMYSGILTSLFGGFYLFVFMVKARRRGKAGLCPICSYDLRAHQPDDRCPECGIVITTSSPNYLPSPSSTRIS